MTKSNTDCERHTLQFPFDFGIYTIRYLAALSSWASFQVN